MPSLTFELDVELEDGHGQAYRVVADQRDVARWEVQPFGWPVVRLEENASMGFFRFLAWSAAVRQGRTALAWEEFDRQCVEAMPVGEEDDASDDAEDPGQQAPSDTPM
jgi:hypothetical protein